MLDQSLRDIESDSGSSTIPATSSTNSLMSLVGSSSNILSRSARRALGKMKGHTTTNTSNSIKLCAILMIKVARLLILLVMAL